MSLSNDHATVDSSFGSSPGDVATVPLAPALDSAIAPVEEAPFDEMVRTELSEKLDTVADSVDPVAALDSAVRSVAEELGRRSFEHGDRGAAPGQDGVIGSAVETLVNVALAMDDPVSALEEGADSLAEALAAREIAAQNQLRSAHERQADEQAAYHHARFHRVSELIDTGYSLDQAITITNANEADIRARAVATGRNPMEPIYKYAVLNGYRGTPPERPVAAVRDRRSAETVGRPSSAMEALAQLSDEAFAEATKGERWHRLMRR